MTRRLLRHAHAWGRSRTGRVCTAVAGALALSSGALQWLAVLSLVHVLLLAALIFVLAVAGNLLVQRHRRGRADDTDRAGA